MHTETNYLLRKLAERKSVHLNNKDWWRFDQFTYPNPKSPEMHTLKPLLGEGVSLQKIIDQRKASGRSTHILELFGSGKFLPNPKSADTITGVRLKDITYTDHPDRQTMSRPSHHTVLEGDLFEEKTWTGISQHMEYKSISSFDMVVCAPGAGWDSYENLGSQAAWLSIYYPILQKTYDLLSPNDGTLYTAVPMNIKITAEPLEEWGERMNDARIKTKIVANPKIGSRLLTLTNTPHLVQITKHKDSPSQIVPLTTWCSLRPEKP